MSTLIVEIKNEEDAGKIASYAKKLGYSPKMMRQKKAKTGLTKKSTRATTVKKYDPVKDAYGMWEDNDVSLEYIRRQAWDRKK